MNATISLTNEKADPAWDEAFLRVESYLRALHVDSRVMLNRLATMILADARSVALTRSEHPVTLSLEIVQSRLDAWFARLWKSDDATGDKFRVKGRLALVMADLKGEWAQYFLAGEDPPANLVASMAGATLQAGPAVHFSNMPPAPLEFETAEYRQELQPAMRWVFARAAGVWIAIFALMGMAWAASH